MMIKRLFLGFLVFGLAACGEAPSPHNAPSASSQSPARLIASNFPLYFFAREIAGDSVDVEFPAIEGDPAFWKPNSDSIATMQSSDLVILNGAGYESWLTWVSLPEGIVLDTSLGFRDRLIPQTEAAVHQHGPEGEHSHAGYAFTIWLDPSLATEQARAIESAISRLAPHNSEQHAERLAQLEPRLQRLDEDLAAAFLPFNDQPVVFSHPVYQYLAARYQLDGVSVHWEPGEAPGTSAWIEFGEIQ